MVNKTKKRANRLLKEGTLPVVEDVLDDLARELGEFEDHEDEEEFAGVTKVTELAVKNIDVEGEEKQKVSETMQQNDDDEIEIQLSPGQKKKQQLPAFDEKDIYKHDLVRVLDVQSKWAMEPIEHINMDNKFDNAFDGFIQNIDKQ